ncbi:hypothetical protein K493DRAFT_323323 [Basidiobolus meristosporus CBS 931.73]|uniref:Uncharacterized protein n=1 Tax=Basidiobolus meristosporus CBS 931.73 TaxID=1314790 RepID=A0A1Y1YXB9_9FUNG|nr:hypothetical protein K493DRAFT_323323 [Basidiobolus meristosporus CBS 931.73]|eukprot:ORY02317.1 hypothetical protein K493DRAFT_323323 [Basidiobolus meristosporus CBS 931.73]
MKLAPSKEDITVATLTTSDRFHVSEELVQTYQGKGAISVALHVPDDDKKEEVVHRLAQIRTDYFLLLNVDSYLCVDFRQNLKGYPEMMKRMKDGQVAIVFPAFKYSPDLLGLVQEKRVDMFHKSRVNGHGSTDYTRWYASKQPYVIVKKEGAPWSNERFLGYGGNKAACPYEIYLSGIEHWVLPNDFIVHQNHDYLESTRKVERKLNKIYEIFREEAACEW